MKLAHINPIRLEPLIIEAKERATVTNVSADEKLTAATTWSKLAERKKAEENYLVMQMISWVVWIVGCFFCIAMMLFFADIFLLIRDRSAYVFTAVFAFGVFLIWLAITLQRPHLKRLRSDIAKIFPMPDDIAEDR
jgi:beta-lactamase regulating signal transducer with metallopeptidase domain